MRMMKRRLTIWSTVLIIVISSISLSGCMQTLYPSILKENYDSSSEVQQVQISPEQSNTMQKQSVTMYFQYKQYDILTAVTKDVSTSSDQRIEKQVINEMLSGASSDTSSDLALPVNSGTTVESISENKDYLFVTLSSDFLKPTPGIADNWKDNNDLRKQVYENRQLTIYAIVNTITEMGTYSRVQILIDTDGTGNGSRPTREELGFADGSENDTQPIEPLSRNVSVIADPIWSMNQIMTCFFAGDFDGAAELVTTQDPLLTQSITDKDIETELNSLNGLLASYTILSQEVSGDGQSAIVMMDIDLLVSGGKTYEINNVPMRMLRESGIWKLSYPSLAKLLSQ